MGFKGNRGPLLLMALAFLVIIIIVAAAASSASPPKKTDPSPTMNPSIVTVTIEKAIGINHITITNLNTGTSIKKTLIDLPYSFNASPGDYLRFSETTQEGYVWNAWQFDDGTFDNHNPMTISVDGNLVMSPKCIITSDASNSTITGD